MKPKYAGLLLALVAVACFALWYSRSGIGDTANGYAFDPASALASGEHVAPAPIVAPLHPMPDVGANKPPSDTRESDRRSVPVPALKPDAEPAIRGKVIDELGAPVGRFEISSRRAGAEQASKAARVKREVQSFENEHGDFALDDLEAGEWLLDAHSPAGMRSSSVLVRVPQVESPAVIVLPSPTLILGSVFLPNGSPASDAGVWTWTPGADEPDFSEDSPSAPTTRCDSRGSFALSDVQPGGLRVLAGLPVSNAGVTILRAADPGADEQATLVERLRWTHTDGRGRFEFQLLPPGTYVLRATDKIFARQEDKRIPFGRVVVPDIRVEAGPATPQSIRLLPEGFIRGRVTDPQGNGVGSARLRMFDLAGVSLSATWNVAADESGDFEIDSLAPGSYLIGARVGDALGQRVPVEVEEGKTTQATVQFP